MAFYNNSLNFPNLTSKSVPIGADLVMIADSAAANQPKQTTIANILANNDNYLGQLNAGNSFASTSILTGYKGYQIIMNNTGGSAGGIYATGSNQIEVGFQLYISGAYVTTGYGCFCSGVNGYNQAVVSVGPNLASESMILFPAFSKTPSLFQMNATLMTTSMNHLLDFTALSSTVDEQVAFRLSGIGFLAATGTATGIKLFFGGSGALTGGSTSYFSVFGIPNL